MPFMLDLLYSQLFVTIPDQKVDFSNQTIIVTGSNTGLGKEAARQLVTLNAAKVILAVRTISKGEAAAAEIAKSCNVSPSRIEVWQLDMSNKDSITAFAKRAATLDRLDAAILNAGVLSAKWQEIDGTESHLAVNVIGAVLLELSLLPILQQSAARTGSRGRLTLVGSDAMYIVKPAELQTEGSMFQRLNTRGALPEGNYYIYSKLLVYHAARHIAALNPVSDQSNVLITVQTPGACKSDLFRDDAGFFKGLGMRIAVALLARTTETGARTLVHAVRPDLPTEVHGGFLMDCQAQKPKYSVAEDDEVSLEVGKKWKKEIFEIMEGIQPGITRV